MFRPVDLAFQPGLYANRSRRGSQQRWVDGAFVRFRDVVPQQMGGWRSLTFTSGEIATVVRKIHCWRPNSQLGRYGFFGGNDRALLLDGLKLTDISPADDIDGRHKAMVATGYGVGPYGTGLYGVDRTSEGVYLEAAQWTADNFGDVLVACSTTSRRIYDFDVTAGDQALQPLANAPRARAICVSAERHVFAFGCDDLPGSVRWSDRENRDVWEPLATNRAGGFEFQVASPFQCGLRVRGNVMAWTLTDCVVFFPLNNALVYGNEKLSNEAGVAGPNAVCVVTTDGGEAAFWMNTRSFFVFDGALRELDSELRDYVFDDINLAQRSQFHVAHNGAFREVWFFYCSAGSEQNDRAVVYDYERRVWSKAPVGRTAWADGGVFDNPLATSAEGVAYWHEIGEDADGERMGSFVLSHPILLGDGRQFVEVDQFWPDMTPESKACTVTVIGRDRAGGPEIQQGPFEFLPSSQTVYLALTAREVEFRIDGIAGAWELGVPKVSMQGGSLR